MLLLLYALIIFSVIWIFHMCVKFRVFKFTRGSLNSRFFYKLENREIEDPLIKHQ